MSRRPDDPAVGDESAAPLGIVLADLLRAVLVALALTALLPAVALLGLLDLPPEWDPRVASVAWHLTTDERSARELADQLRPRVEPASALHVEVEGGEPWLVLAGPRAREAPSVIGAALGERGVWSGSLRIESGFGRVLARSLAEPARAAGVLPLLVPWMLLCSGAGFLAVALRGRRRRPEPRLERAGATGKRVFAGLVAGALLVGLTQLASRLLALAGLAPTEQPLVTAVAEAGGVPFAAFALVAVLLVPIAEELFFRGHVFRLLSARGPSRDAHGITALLFASVHLNPAAFPVYLLYSAGLSLAYARSGSILVPVLAHAVVNATGVALLAR